jgi:hypothetical protein
MNYPEDARIQERDNMKIALATFALQLNAFEMRMNGAWLAADPGTGLRVPPPDRLQFSKGKYDWGSLSSAGSKSAT